MSENTKAPLPREWINLSGLACPDINICFATPSTLADVCLDMMEVLS
jgi:hypothetical protein